MTENQWNPTAKSKRCYHRVISGVERGGRLRFLTLTSSDAAPEDIQRSWRKLYMRLKRRNLLDGYIKVVEQAPDGRKHLHILIRGPFIKQAIIKAMWTDIHQSSIVDIRLVKPRRTPAAMASYMAKYMSKEHAGRYSWSWAWVWRGFVGHWTILKRYVRWCYYDKDVNPMPMVLKLWRFYLKTGKQPDWELFALRTPSGMW